MSAPRFTREQRLAIEDRSGSALLAANAGSGKTAVMVERLVEAVRVDGVAVGAILALTFTEKAAGELRERARRRLADLGEDEHARAVDGAWIGTIHGFCARVLRSRPLSAGLDPRFEVLDEPAARRLAGVVYERALEAWVSALGGPAVDLAAAYGPGLRDIVLAAHDILRSRGATHPRLTVPPPSAVPDAGALRARPVPGPHASWPGPVPACASRRPAPLSRPVSAWSAPRPGPSPRPGRSIPASSSAGGKALGTEACEAYREAWTGYRAACADHHARAALVLLDDLLARFAAAYAEAKAARAGVDFEDLELGVRDLLADGAERRRWSERFALIMVDEFQDTNRLQLDLLEALERGNLFAVGDEFQSIYRFRHADVDIFRERRAQLGESRVRGLATNFRSDEELLDVLNATFAPELGKEFRPLIAGRRGPARTAADGELRLFDPDPPAGQPPVELLVTDTRGWEDRAGEIGLAGLADQPWRRAEARVVAHRLREEVAAGRRPGDVVVLVRATASLRLFEQALEEQGLPTYVVGGRGYWSQEQVRDGLAYLAALANPRDEAAFYAPSPRRFCGVGSDALVLLAQAGATAAAGRGPLAARAAQDRQVVARHRDRPLEQRLHRKPLRAAPLGIEEAREAEQPLPVVGPERGQPVAAGAGDRCRPPGRPAPGAPPPAARPTARGRRRARPARGARGRRCPRRRTARRGRSRRPLRRAGWPAPRDRRARRGPAPVTSSPGRRPRRSAAPAPRAPARTTAATRSPARGRRRRRAGDPRRPPRAADGPRRGPPPAARAGRRAPRARSRPPGPPSRGCP
jgi:hypothetical protein